MKKDHDGAGLARLWLGLALAVFSACRVGSDRPPKDSPFLFVDVTDECRVASHFGSDFYAWADINNDGFLDLFVANAPRQEAPSLIFVNNRDGTFSKCYEFADINVNGNVYGAWSDFTCDGFMDLTIFSTKNGGTVSLFENNGRCGFKPRGEFSALAFGWADLNEDGAIDLVLTNLAGRSEEEKRRSSHALLINDGYGGFQRTIEIDSEGGLGFGMAIGDFDNDGELDLYIQDGEKNLFYRHRGSLRFQKIGVLVSERDGQRGAAGNKASTVDYDNDGDLDIFISTGDDRGYSPDQASGQARNALGLFRNESQPRSWLKLKLEGTQSNREGVGANIFLRAGGRVLFREANHGPSGYAQEALPVHFGLGGASQADEIEIRWPSGIRQIVKNVPALQTRLIKEPATSVLNSEQRE